MRRRRRPTRAAGRRPSPTSGSSRSPNRRGAGSPAAAILPWPPVSPLFQLARAGHHAARDPCAAVARRIRAIVVLALVKDECRAPALEQRGRPRPEIDARVRVLEVPLPVRVHRDVRQISRVRTARVVEAVLGDGGVVVAARGGEWLGLYG